MKSVNEVSVPCEKEGKLRGRQPSPDVGDKYLRSSGSVSITATHTHTQMHTHTPHTPHTQTICSINTDKKGNHLIFNNKKITNISLKFSCG